MRPLDPTREGLSMILSGFSCTQGLIMRVAEYHALRKKMTTKKVYHSQVMRDLIEAGLKVEMQRVVNLEPPG